MDQSTPSSADVSRSATPNPRFTSQASTAEDILKEQTVGLVNLSDFRKRRAEAQTGTPNGGSGATTPRDGASTPQPFKKKRKVVKKGNLSFGGDDEEEEGDGESAGRSKTPSSRPTSRSETPDAGDTDAPTSENGNRPFKKRLKPNAGVAFAPKAMTKAALLRDAQQKEQDRKDFQAMREVTKATDFMLPFVFYDGTNTAGGKCRMKKGDHIWLFLDKARKVGAELGVGGGDKSKREWARVSVDDLMLVRGDIIVPHHYEFYHFMAKKVLGFDGQPIFAHSPNPTNASPLSLETGYATSAPYDPLAKPTKKEDAPLIPESELEGFQEDAANTKVVDRRWYEKNKHIYPASIWEEFNPERDYANSERKDVSGNRFFFS